MTNIGEFSADGYGMAILSTDLLTEYLKDKNCRAKKLISYFDKHKDLFFESIKAGRFLPFYRIASFEYSIFVSVDEKGVEIPADYNEVFRFNGFYLEVGKIGKVCLASFNYLEYHLEDVKNGMTDKENIIPSGPKEILEKYYPAKGLDIDPGVYEFDLIGLERKTPLERKSKNYGYAFVFRSNVDAKNNNYEKADNDVYVFDVISYKK